MAFRNAGWRRGSFALPKNQFWINIDGNFLDIAVLEWCKLFGDKRGKHFWRKVVTAEHEFLDGLLKVLDVTDAGFDAYIEEVKTYRDRFVAHLDDDEEMQIPNLRLMKISVSYLFDYILANEDEGGYFNDAPKSAAAHYHKYLKEGQAVYAEAT